MAQSNLNSTQLSFTADGTVSSTNDNEIESTSGNIIITNSGDSMTWPPVAGTSNQILSAGDGSKVMKWVTLPVHWDLGIDERAWYCNLNPTSVTGCNVNQDAFWNTSAGDYSVVINQSVINQVGRLYIDLGKTLNNWEVRATIFAGFGSGGGATGLWIFGGCTSACLGQFEDVRPGISVMMNDPANSLVARTDISGVSTVIGSDNQNIINFDDGTYRTISLRKIGDQLSFTYNIFNGSGTTFTTGGRTLFNVTLPDATKGTTGSYFGVGARTSGGPTNTYICSYLEIRSFDYLL